MTVLTPPARSGAARRRPGRFLAELEGASPVGFVPPSWFAPVMGTGIVAVALVGLPFEVPGARPVALGFWLLAVALMLAATTATVVHHVQHPRIARGHLDDPVLAHYYGAPAMALMTVGAGAVLVGADVIGARVALGLDVVLWTAGTLLGLATAVVVPLRVLTRPEVGLDDAFGGWLMSVVPAMVSAATGSLLVARAPAGTAQQTLLVACYALFGAALVAGVAVTAMILRRLVRVGVGPAAGVPTLWIVLGWPGQSITATHLLGDLAPDVLPGPTGRALQDLGLLYGLPVLGLALLWLGLVAVLTARTVRRGMPFTLSWWSFTFPVGTVVTGTSGLAATTGLPALDVLAGLLVLLLLTAWAVVAARTARGAYVGRLLRAPA